MTSASDEIILEVDERNRALGPTPRSRLRAQALWHRSSYVFLRNSAGRWAVSLRTLSKDYCPGLLDLAAGGVVAYGEDNHENAQRELLEELGVFAPLWPVGSFAYQDANSRVFGHVWLALSDQQPRLQASEVAALHWLTTDEIDALPPEQVTPDSWHAWQWFKQSVWFDHAPD